jgi:hypothetical protein
MLYGVLLPQSSKWYHVHSPPILVYPAMSSYNCTSTLSFASTFISIS